MLKLFSLTPCSFIVKTGEIFFSNGITFAQDYLFITGYDFECVKMNQSTSHGVNVFVVQNVMYLTN